MVLTIEIAVGVAIGTCITMSVWLAIQRSRRNRKEFLRNFMFRAADEGWWHRRRKDSELEAEYTHHFTREELDNANLKSEESWNEVEAQMEEWCKEDDKKHGYPSLGRIIWAKYKDEILGK
jgi:hypothetical protein